jgi:hypothetical protein
MATKIFAAPAPAGWLVGSIAFDIEVPGEKMKKQTVIEFQCSGELKSPLRRGQHDLVSPTMNN